jgi:hypothetical protein
MAIFSRVATSAHGRVSPDVAYPANAADKRARGGAPELMALPAELWTIRL